jgi:hypothetical protein
VERFDSLKNRTTHENLIFSLLSFGICHLRSVRLCRHSTGPSPRRDDFNARLSASRVLGLVATSSARIVRQLAPLKAARHMSNQHIGAIFDKVLFIVLGIFGLIVKPKFLGKNLGPEETKKRLKIVRICGVILILCGIGSFILM